MHPPAVNGIPGRPAPGTGEEFALPAPGELGSGGPLAGSGRADRWLYRSLRRGAGQGRARAKLWGTPAGFAVSFAVLLRRPGGAVPRSRQAEARGRRAAPANGALAWGRGGNAALAGGWAQAGRRHHHSPGHPWSRAVGGPGTPHPPAGLCCPEEPPLWLGFGAPGHACVTSGAQAAVSCGSAAPCWQARAGT